ncbi:MAG: bifunctional pyr operon transcriptional regulator/uracil phosphoribosyltransferase PyrR [Candidatus Makaraimicrobium thalassicum]|nr:MAG: bifunctional pyr operon transcriptional regulator/uracil phosphoribosyltransferase PyrR [Candidatus Omnitrophota bacterium]
MNPKIKSRVLDAEGIKRILQRIAHEIVEKNQGTEDIVVVGIKNRGAYLAERIAKGMEAIQGKAVPVGALDITLYRDDLTEIAEQPVVHSSEIEFDITAKKIILVDDVLFTGRTVRCALDELIDFGRPANIQLAVLIDRGHRELPIRPDFIGKNIPTSAKESIEVRLREIDGVEEVIVVGAEQGSGV